MTEQQLQEIEGRLAGGEAYLRAVGYYDQADALALIAALRQATAERDAAKARADRQTEEANHWYHRQVDTQAQIDTFKQLVDQTREKLAANAIVWQAQQDALTAALAEARRVLRLVMYDTPCTSASCARCVETRTAVAAVLTQEEK
jgi:malate synthase